jgi:hypothetical protein
MLTPPTHRKILQMILFHRDAVQGTLTGFFPTVGEVRQFLILGLKIWNISFLLSHLQSLYSPLSTPS